MTLIRNNDNFLYSNQKQPNTDGRNELIWHQIQMFWPEDKIKAWHSSGLFLIKNKQENAYMKMPKNLSVIQCVSIQRTNIVIRKGNLRLWLMVQKQWEAVVKSYDL